MIVTLTFLGTYAFAYRLFPLIPFEKGGHFEILALLGAGGMGEVYRAKDTRLEREVAIKILPEALAEDPDWLARFERETKVLAVLNHHRDCASSYRIAGRTLVLRRSTIAPRAVSMRA